MTAWVLSASMLTLAVIILRTVFRKHISRGLQYALWGLVMLRLIIPFSLFYVPLNVESIVPEGSGSSQVYVFPVSRQTAENVSADDTDESGLIIHDANSMGYSVLSPDGKTVTRYLDKTSVGELLSIIWISGSIAAGIWFISVNAVFGMRLKKSRKAIDTVKCRLPVYVTDRVVSPCLFGIFRPSVYLTPKAAAHDNSINHIIEHELCHFRHGDNIWSIMRGICIAIWWWNPLVWVAAYLSRADSELFCDQSVIKRIGEDSRLSYGHTLVDMVALKRGSHGLMHTATTMTSGKRGVKERLNMIINNPKAFVSAVIAVILIAALCAGCAFAGAAEKAPEEKAPENSGVFVTIDCEAEIYSFGWEAGSTGGRVSAPDGSPFKKGERVHITDFEGSADYTLTAYGKEEEPLVSSGFLHDFSEEPVSELKLTGDMRLVDTSISVPKYYVQRIERGLPTTSPTTSEEINALADDMIMNMMYKSSVLDGQNISSLYECYLIRQNFDNGEIHDYYAYTIPDAKMPVIDTAVLQAGEDGYCALIDNELYKRLEMLIPGADVDSDVLIKFAQTVDFSDWKNGQRVCKEFSLYRSVIDIPEMNARMNSNGAFETSPTQFITGETATRSFCWDEADDAQYILLDVAVGDNISQVMKVFGTDYRIRLDRVKYDPQVFFGRKTPVTELTREVYGSADSSYAGVNTIYSMIYSDDTGEHAAAFMFWNAEEVYEPNERGDFNLYQSESDCEQWMKTLVFK